MSDEKIMVLIDGSEPADHAFGVHFSHLCSVCLTLPLPFDKFRFAQLKDKQSRSRTITTSSGLFTLPQLKDGGHPEPCTLATFPLLFCYFAALSPFFCHFHPCDVFAFPGWHGVSSGLFTATGTLLAKLWKGRISVPGNSVT